jgi:hypothetical protein
MGKAIVTSIMLVLIVAIIAYVIRRTMKEANEVGDLNLKQERQLRRLVDDAAVVMRSLGVGFDIQGSDILSDRSQATVNQWLQRYDTYHQKEINA